MEINLQNETMELELGKKKISILNYDNSHNN